MSKQLKWLMADRTEAEAYVVAANSWWATNLEPGGTFCILTEYDDTDLPENSALEPKYPGGALVCAFLGPNQTWFGEIVPEPEELAGLYPNAAGPGVFPPPSETEE